MACTRWDDDWIAHLYGECSEEEARQIDRHLTDCADCRSTWNELERSRAALRTATPVVPASPRLMLVPSRGWHPAWAFAAGLACAGLLFSAGVLVAGGFPGEASEPTAGPRVAAVSAADLDARFEAFGEELDRRVAAMEARNSGVTREDIETILADYRKSANAEQARWVDFVLHEIDDAARHAGNQINQNREALRYALLASKPGVSEQ